MSVVKRTETSDVNSKNKPFEAVLLESSHGRVHLHPNDIHHPCLLFIKTGNSETYHIEFILFVLGCSISKEEERNITLGKLSAEIEAASSYRPLLDYLGQFFL